MTVRSILDNKGHQIQSIEPNAKLSAAVKILGERKIGAVLVMDQGKLEGILSERDIVRVLGERGARVLEEPVSAVWISSVFCRGRSSFLSCVLRRCASARFLFSCARWRICLPRIYAGLRQILCA